MSTWNLIANREDWQRHCLSLAQTNNLHPTEVAWGSGPKTYPCLAATLVTPPMPGGNAKMTTAYVYPDDAKKLLLAAGEAQPTKGQALAPGSPTQDQFNRWISAEILAVVHFLVETGICKPDQFEEMIITKLEMVDAWKKEKTEEIRERLGKPGVSLLQGLDPAS